MKRDYLALEHNQREEKACLLKVVNTFGSIVDMHPEFRQAYRSIKALLNNGPDLPLERIEEETGNLRTQVFAEETKRGAHAGPTGEINELKRRLSESCMTVKRITVALLDDFYPVTGALKAKGDAIHIDCRGDMAQAEFEEATTTFMEYVKGLKGKIFGDFKYINGIFLTLLDQVKALEKAFTAEFGGEDRIEEIARFEQKVHREVGSIVDSFSLHATIDELKSAVVKGLSNIKLMVAVRKREETKKSRKAQANMIRLQKRIAEAEKDAREMSRKAEHFQKAAKRDGLTGLYNRKAFDMKVEEALKTLQRGGETFALVIFDVDKLKWINDTFGHVAGDKVLRKVAQALRETFRKHDFIARYGGDEFAVLIERMTEAMARERIDVFNENFSRKRFFSRKEGRIQVNISVGIATALAGESPEGLIHRADMAMYGIKRKKS